MQKRHTHLYHFYQSWKHVLATVVIVALPFLFFLIFTRSVHITSGSLTLAVVASVSRLFVAYAIAAALAWVLAVLFYRGRRAVFALPIFDVLQSFPTFAILPLATYFFGATNTMVVVFLVVTIIWPILFSLVSSLKLIKRDWEEAAEMAGLSGSRYFRYFLWPASIPGLVTGSIIGLGDGWEAFVAAEIISGIKSGLGGFFSAFSGNAGVTAFGVFGLLLLIFVINKLLWLPLLEWSHGRMEE